MGADFKAMLVAGYAIPKDIEEIFLEEYPYGDQVFLTNSYKSNPIWIFGEILDETEQTEFVKENKISCEYIKNIPDFLNVIQKEYKKALNKFKLDIALAEKPPEIHLILNIW